MFGRIKLNATKHTRSIGYVVAVTVTNSNRAESRRIQLKSEDMHCGTRTPLVVACQAGALPHTPLPHAPLFQPNSTLRHSRPDSGITTSRRLSMTVPGGAGCLSPSWHVRHLPGGVGVDVGAEGAPWDPHRSAHHPLSVLRLFRTRPLPPSL